MTRLLPTLVLTFLATACTHRVDFGSYGRLEDPAFILRTIEARYSRVQGLAGEGKLGIRSPQGSGTLRMAVEVRKPESLYLETRDILGIARGTFATGGERFYFYRPDENVLYTGPATAEELGRFLPMALPPERLAGALLGEIPLLQGAELSLEVDERSATYLLVLRKDAELQRVRVGTKDLRLVSIETRGGEPIDAAFSNHEEKIPGVPFARTIELELPAQRTKVKVHYTSYQLNPSTSPGDFVIQVPPGARIEES